MNPLLAEPRQGEAAGVQAARTTTPACSDLEVRGAEMALGRAVTRTIGLIPVARLLARAQGDKAAKAAPHPQILGRLLQSTRRIP